MVLSGVNEVSYIDALDWSGYAHVFMPLDLDNGS